MTKIYSNRADTKEFCEGRAAISGNVEPSQDHSHCPTTDASTVPQSQLSNPSHLPMRVIRVGSIPGETPQSTFSIKPDILHGAEELANIAAPRSSQCRKVFVVSDPGQSVTSFRNRQRLVLTPQKRDELAIVFGAEALAERLEYDAFASVETLQRQLAFEQKSEMSSTQFYGIDPARLPAGWIAHDQEINRGQGLRSLRSVLRGPAGECGTVVRSFNGCTLYLDEAYKSSLPSKLGDVPGFGHPVATMNYMTARACRLLNINAENLGSIKINRLQHRPTLVHLDWLQSNYPQRSLSELFGHTTWAKKYLRQCAANIGHVLDAEPEIALQGSTQWKAAHPGAVERDWDYTDAEARRLALVHMTGYDIAKVDDPSIDWKHNAEEAIDRFKKDRCVNLSPAAAGAESTRIDKMITERLEALEKSDVALAERYALPNNYAPRHLNFDVTYRTKRM